MRFRLAAVAAILTCALTSPALAAKSKTRTATTTTTAAATTTTTATATTLAAPAPSMPFGFSDQAVMGNQISASDDAALAARAGATSSRVTFDWRWAEPTQGNWKLSTYDAIYNADLAAGIKPVFVLLFAPQWTFDSSVTCVQASQDCKYPPGPAHLDAWKTMVTKLVTRYPQLAGIEVWNEPNDHTYWASQLDPAYYTTLLKSAHDAVNAAGSSIPVLGGALSGVNESDAAASSQFMAYRAFLKGMYAAGAKGAMDRLSVHPYPDDVDLWRFFKMLTEVRDIRDDNGDSATPLFVSETGVTTTGTGGGTLTERYQALTLDRIIRDLRGMPDVAGAEVHTLIDVARISSTQGGFGFGVVGTDLTPKPAYCSIAKLQGSSYSCTPPAADTTQNARWDAQEMVQAAVDAARKYRGTTGSFNGLTSSILHSIDSRISATAPLGTTLPGALADPSKIYVSAWSGNVLVCAASKADRTYCATSSAGAPWTYGMSTLSINATAGSLLGGSVWWW